MEALIQRGEKRVTGFDWQLHSVGAKWGKPLCRKPGVPHSRAVGQVVL
eukprot:CAMPEP_0204177520 /NCGR_PEP_ID=MMETSP0361-20130328/48554_1 /ASSEMBLY_ACC=CAM_ASM_000343 /TAXON_ID=268821 /ORGANISM="Scrippsiella Hangoei, Strain SHTV-5" /LENGTH=47 /DNA_ID= /DNA_START= /DNA_END= /DNA_ORIENTATION=